MPAPARRRFNGRRLFFLESSSSSNRTPADPHQPAEIKHASSHHARPQVFFFIGASGR